MAASLPACFGIARKNIEEIGKGSMGEGTTGNLCDSLRYTKDASRILVSVTEAHEGQLGVLQRRVAVLEAQQAESLRLIDSLSKRIATLERR